jgi:glutamate-1-semialdehyde 2,1-aminomutase
MTHFPTNGMTSINNAADAAKCDSAKLFNYHFEMIARDGIFFLPGKLGAFSDAHSTKDVRDMKKSTERFVSNFKK